MAKDWFGNHLFVGLLKFQEHIGKLESSRRQTRLNTGKYSSTGRSLAARLRAVKCSEWFPHFHYF
jgi:hypothetical protein